MKSQIIREGDVKMSAKKIPSLQGLRMLLFLAIFFFHSSMYIGDKKIYSMILEGGGAQAVTYFFILSGFVTSLSAMRISIDSKKQYVKYIISKVKKFYPYHIAFFFFAIPLNYYFILHNTKTAIFRASINVLLLQSWFPRNEIWLSYNGVSWFLSTLTFLICIMPILVWIDSKLKETSKRKQIIIGIILGCGLIEGVLALIVDMNYRYWLYAFPPVRVLDYAAGFFLGRLFCESKKKDSYDKKRATELEVLALIVYAGTLLFFPSCDEAIRRSALYFPGALLAVWAFGMNRGMVSCFFSRRLFVRLGDATLYYMMSHQIILYYVEKIYSRLSIDLGAMDWVCVGASLLITIMSEPIFGKILVNLQSVMVDKRKIREVENKGKENTNLY